MSDAILVYGASGYTGRLICAELKRKGLPFLVAGRDQVKLRRLASSVGDPEVLVAPIDDAAALERAARRCQVLVDCAGPFSRMGRPVQDAALAAGVHFLDITGELAYMRATFARDAEAKARGVAMINAVGFDVVPTDCAAVLASDAAGSPTERVRLAFASKPTQPTQGTTRSAIESMRLGSMAWVDGAWRAESIGHEVWDVPFRGPIGRRTCVSVPWGDIATAPRSTGARQVRTFMSMSPSLARMGRWFGGVTGWKPVQSLAERWVRTLPEGPTDAERARSTFAVFAEAVGPKGFHTAWVTGGNGYDFTAASAVLCAELCLRPDFAGRGAITPTQAFGANQLLEGLSSVIRWGVD